MKKEISIFLTSVFVLLFMTITVYAQSNNAEDFFIGKWKITAYGLPQGDIEMLVTFDKKEGNLSGNITTVQDTTQLIPFTKTELYGNSITAYYTAQGYDVYFTLEKGEGENVTGSMMEMFDIKGTKINK
ncbi:MAG: hypothetical protein JXB49_23125 [Bacteroidales bacterium]|nr:hypothetical protein [Bacteroidales bacterium]